MRRDVLDEVVAGMVVRSLPAHGREGIEDSGFGLFEIRRARTRFGILFFRDFDMSDGLLRPSPLLSRRERVE